MYDHALVVYVDSDLEDLIPMFLENRHKDVDEIGRLLREGNLGEIKRLGHSMKGSGGGYGFDEISQIGGDMEEAAKCGNTAEIEKLNERLAEYLSLVEVIVQNG